MNTRQGGKWSIDRSVIINKVKKKQRRCVGDVARSKIAEPGENSLISRGSDKAVAPLWYGMPMEFPRFRFRSRRAAYAGSQARMEIYSRTGRVQPKTPRAQWNPTSVQRHEFTHRRTRTTCMYPTRSPEVEPTHSSARIVFYAMPSCPPATAWRTATPGRL